MLKSIIDKIRDNNGPLKSVRLVVADIAEETLDLASHYIKKIRNKSDIADGPPMQDVPIPVQKPQAPPTTKSTTKSPGRKSKAGKAKKSSVASKKSKTTEKKLKRVLDVSEEFAAALENPANQRKQEFKVLAILFDARNRNQAGMSAKDLSDHGEKLGLAIRHENIRKVIKMRLSTYVEILQEVDSRASIYHYRLNNAGENFFKDKYLS